MSVHHPTTNDEYDALKAKAGLVVVDFSASWCGPCKAIAPVFAAEAAANTDVTFVHVDVDELDELPDGSDVSGVPTFKFYKNGELKAKFSGANKDKLKQLIGEHK